MKYYVKKTLLPLFINKQMGIPYSHITDLESVVVDKEKKLTGVRFTYEGKVHMIKVDESQQKPTFEVV